MKIRNIFINGMSKLINFEQLKFFNSLFLRKLRAKMSGNYIIWYILQKYLDIFLINPYYENVIALKIFTFWIYACT
jgi:hypothetical protein